MSTPVLSNKFISFSNEFLTPYKTLTPPFGFNGMGYIVYKRTYARNICADCNSYSIDYNKATKSDFCTACDSISIRTEEWWETTRRCVEGAQEIGAGYTVEEAERLYDYMFNLKGSFGGRMLWQLGTDTVRSYGGASLLNCWFISMNQPEDFCFLFENLMLGGGVGFSVRREDIHELPKVKEGVTIQHLNTNDADFIVPDSREGWVSLLRKTLEAHFVTGKSFSYSTVLIRGYGERIKRFGGTASGPNILIEGITKLSVILKSREGKKLRSIDVLDINNILGSIVVAGNVRRSAEIAIGDADDIHYLKAKRWDLGNIPNWRAMSNNSIYADSFDYIMPQIWQGYQGNGEPYGLINLPLSQKYGRIKDGLMKTSDIYPTSEDNCEGYNPCAEISLGDGEACNLCEIYLNNVSSKEELIDVSRLLYKTQKCIWTLPFHYEKTKKIVSKNFRTGLGITGVYQSLDKIEWLDDCYTELRKFDKTWSKANGWPESIKLTTIKPSGTLSILGGATPGAHPAFSKFHIRRVRMSSQDKMVGICREAGFHVEYVKNFDGTDSRDTVVIEFPCKIDGAIYAEDLSAIDMLEMIKKLQSEWSDNSVSVTVYYKKEELDQIKGWLEANYDKNIKSVSFLLHQGHGFIQAPYEPITEEQYEKSIKKIDFTQLKTIDGGILEDLSCAGGVCPVR